MSKRRRLGDLYVRGKEVTFDDGEGDPITVWVRKMTPVDHETAMRHSNAARSRVFAARRRPDSDEYMAMWMEVDELTTEELVNYLALEETQARENAIEAELGAEEEWSKDDYVQGLLDAWNGGLERRYAEDPEDEEAANCFKEMSRFNDELQKRLDGLTESVVADLETKPFEVLQEQVFEKIVNLKASMGWLAEYRRMEVFLGTRESDKRTRYFTKRSEIDDISLEVYAELSAAYREISVDPLEGKDSEETPDSSSSSEQSDAEVTGLSSGQTDAAA